MLNVDDVFTRECHRMDGDTSLTGARVTKVLDETRVQVRPSVEGARDELRPVVDHDGLIRRTKDRDQVIAAPALPQSSRFA
jgi:hypothetical protein